MYPQKKLSPMDYCTQIITLYFFPSYYQHYIYIYIYIGFSAIHFGIYNYYPAVCMSKNFCLICTYLPTHFELVKYVMPVVWIKVRGVLGTLSVSPLAVWPGEWLVPHVQYPCASCVGEWLVQYLMSMQYP